MLRVPNLSFESYRRLESNVAPFKLKMANAWIVILNACLRLSLKCLIILLCYVYQVYSSHNKLLLYTVQICIIHLMQVKFIHNIVKLCNLNCGNSF